MLVVSWFPIVLAILLFIGRLGLIFQGLGLLLALEIPEANKYPPLLPTFTVYSAIFAKAPEFTGFAPS